MTTFADRPTITAPRQGVERKESWGSQFVKTVPSTDHKRIGYLYLATSFT
jgi:cytochrome c oxidase subunit 1